MTLTVKQVSKSFGGLKALDGCSFVLKPNMITAIIGPNGCGKSTLFNAITSVIPADKGLISLGRTRINDRKDFQIAKMGISRTFQDVRLFKDLTIREHLSIALGENDESIIRSLFGPERFSDKRLSRYLKLVGLKKSLDTYAKDLSYGQSKLLTLAVAIAKPHKILMLDEPVAGVNPKLRKEIKKVIMELNKKGETVLVIEHDMNFVMDLAHHIIVMDEGRVIVQGTPKEIQNNKQVLEAYLGD